MTSSKDAITNRILSRLGDGGLLDKLLSLPKSDFNSLLLKLYQMQAGSVTPTNIVKAFELNRFSVPSEIDPVAYHLLEAELLTMARESEIKAMLLSPVAPLASCCAFGYVDQNNVVSAVRGTEVVSDPTNMLAIIIAGLLKKKEIDNRTPVHYCSTVRVVRAQVFPARRGYYSHFGIFCIVSSGKDSGSYICERNLLAKQLAYYRKLLIDKYNAKLIVALRKRRGYTDGDGLFGSMAEMVSNELPGVPVSLDHEYEENNYYKGLHFTIYMEKEQERVEIGDGGFVDWTQQMTGNKKERCLISGIGLDRLLI
jgi:hypothetical protein